MKIYKKLAKIVIEIPFWSKRSNPYMQGEEVGEYPTLTGVIWNDEFGNEERGFAQTIDMDYKSKGDQVTDIQIHIWDRNREDFIKLCEELKIEVIEYPICAYCKKTIFGCFTISDKGNMCFSCEHKKDRPE